MAVSIFRLDLCRYFRRTTHSPDCSLCTPRPSSSTANIVRTPAINSLLCPWISQPGLTNHRATTRGCNPLLQNLPYRH